MTIARRDELRNSLPATVALLYKRQAQLIADGEIDEYVTLRWLEWNGGSLRLTTAGQLICDQVSSQVR